MIVAFDPRKGAVVTGYLAGPGGVAKLRLLVDTGANKTLVTPGSIEAAGYDPTRSIRPVAVTTATSAGNVGGLFHARQFTALGLTRADYPILCYSLPANLTFDGLLGRDFFEGHVLTFDFVNNTVELT